MINQKELRIGNLVANEFSKWYAVDEIKNDVCRLIFYGRECLSTIQSYDDLHPIPLTPEILEILGFDKSLRLDIGDFSYRYYSGKGVNVSFKEWPDVANATYLHELQNLYFALTSHELTLTDKK